MRKMIISLFVLFTILFAFVACNPEVKNETPQTKSITLTVKDDEVRQDENLQVSAVISGIDAGYTACWLIDDTKIGDYGTYSDLEYSLESTEVGTHTVVLSVKTGSDTLTKSATFKVLEKARTVTYSLASLTAGNSIDVSADDSTTVELNDFSLADGVYVTALNGTRDLGAVAAELDINLFKTDDGSFIPLPNATNSVHFKGLDIGLSGSGTIKIRKYNVQTDLTISAAEYPEITAVGGMVSEYYYIDFNDAKWENLDPSCIVVTRKNAAGECLSGSSNVTLLQTGYISYNSQMSQIYDLSRGSGFGMYVAKSLNADTYETYDIYSPSSLALNTPITLDATDTKIRIPAQSSGNYAITMKYQDSESFTKATGEIYKLEFGKADGSYLDTIPAPYMDSDTNTITWYLGSLGTDSVMRYYSKENGVIVELSTTDKTFAEPIKISDLSSGDMVFTKGSSDYLTVTFTNEVKTTVYMSGSYGFNALHYNAPGENATWTSIGSESTGHVIYPSAIGYIVVKCKDLNEGDAALILSLNSGEEEITCDEFDYTCMNGIYGYYCPDCSKKVSVWAQKSSLFAGQYTTTAEYSDGSTNYGKLTFDPDTELISSENVLLTLHTFDNTTQKTNYISYNNEDESFWVKLEVEKIVLQPERKLYCKLSIGNNGTTYENVELVSNHKHSWTFETDAAICSSCGESRAYIKLSVSGAVTMNSDIDGLVVAVPSIAFETSANSGEATFPALPNGTTVYIIAPTPEYNLTYTMNGQYVSVKSTKDRTI